MAFKNHKKHIKPKILVLSSINNGFINFIIEAYRSFNQCTN